MDAVDKLAMTQPATHPLVSGHPPPWACGWGRDRHGVFAEFRVGEGIQRMRWIPPGSFWMGSPDEESGRREDECPHRLITLTEGFWLADSACTQERWQEVMDSKPSHFGDRPRNPVESVSWNDVGNFCKKLETRLAGSSSRLPTEAQWEYACRAGEETATWAGELKLSEYRSRDESGVLDSIAWYSGNRGDHESTREVGLKPPNPWGLYDMLGNVFEWVADVRTSDYGEAGSLDPLAEGDASVGRVIRGGSWLSSARSVRAAFRGWEHPGVRYVDLGFRLSLGPSSGAERGAGSRRPVPGAASERGTSRSGPGRDSGGGG